MHGQLSLSEVKKEYHGTYRAYFIGFAISILLTLTSFYLVIDKALPLLYLIPVIIILALTQAVVQLIFFLHLGQEAKPKWESLVFYFMVSILLILVVGTLWVMNDLNERTMHMPTIKMEAPHD